jgi:tRNA dimethylallyltransferase
MSHLIIIAGPTASGKTDQAIELSKKLGGAPIISADSRQIYQEMLIGTAAPTEDQLAAAPHYLVRHRTIHEVYSAGHYEKEAIALLENLFLTHETVILCGGTGLYIKAVMEGLDYFPPIEQEVLDRVEALHVSDGLIGLQTALAAADPTYFAQVDQFNHARLRRALEVCWETGKPYSGFITDKSKSRPFTTEVRLMDISLADLTPRIYTRTKQMLASGLIEEAERLKGFSHLRSLQTVGYQELFLFFAGEINLAKAEELIAIHTRQYARRQMTWFKSQLNHTT